MLVVATRRKPKLDCRAAVELIRDEEKQESNSGQYAAMRSTSAAVYTRSRKPARARRAE
jgi:hypothetical protein